MANYDDCYEALGAISDLRGFCFYEERWRFGPEPLVEWEHPEVNYSKRSKKVEFTGEIAIVREADHLEELLLPFQDSFAEMYAAIQCNATALCTASAGLGPCEFGACIVEPTAFHVVLSICDRIEAAAGDYFRALKVPDTQNCQPWHGLHFDLWLLFKDTDKRTIPRLRARLQQESALLAAMVVKAADEYSPSTAFGRQLTGETKDKKDNRSGQNKKNYVPPMTTHGRTVVRKFRKANAAWKPEQGKKKPSLKAYAFAYAIENNMSKWYLYNMARKNKQDASWTEDIP